MIQIAPEKLEQYLNQFVAQQPNSIANDFRTVLGLVCCFEDQQFLEEIIKPDPKMYGLYLEAEAYITSQINK